MGTSFGDLSELTRPLPLREQLRPNLHGRNSGHAGFRTQGADQVRASSMADLLAPRVPRGSPSCKLGTVAPNMSNTRTSCKSPITFLAEENHGAAPELARLVRPNLSGQGSATTLHTGGAKQSRVRDVPTWPRPVVGQGQPRSGAALAEKYCRPS